MARKNEKSDLAVVISVMEVVGALKGEAVCITGHLGLPRKDIQRIITNAGGRVDENVKPDTTILVSNGDWTALNVPVTADGVKKSSKLIAAERNNLHTWPKGSIQTRVMCEDDFYQLIIDRGQTAHIEPE